VEAKRAPEDYVTLLEDLVAGHPDVIVPGLAVGSFADDDALLRNELNRFLNRVAGHEALRQDPVTVAFLQGEDVRGSLRRVPRPYRDRR
jgi:hypothetical protein